MAGLVNPQPTLFSSFFSPKPSVAGHFFFLSPKPRKNKTQTPNPLFFPNSKHQLAKPRETQQNLPKKKKRRRKIYNKLLQQSN
jgi:hypothetical protein